MAAYDTDVLGAAGREAAPRTKRLWRYDWFGEALRCTDRLLRRYMGIVEFCPDDACIIRIALRTADRDLCLADGTRIRKGEVIGELHLWNEHLPRVSESETAVAWALEIRRLFAFSFAQLAHFVAVDPRFGSMPAFRGGITFASPLYRDAKVGRVMAWFGIETLPTEPGLFASVSEFGNALFTLALLRAFHLGGSIGAPHLRRRHHEVWLSRRVLLERYADARALPGEKKAVAIQKGAA